MTVFWFTEQKDAAEAAAALGWQPEVGEQVEFYVWGNPPRWGRVLGKTTHGRWSVEYETFVTALQANYKQTVDVPLYNLRPIL